MNNLQREINQWHDANFPTELVDAPKDAVTFDKMLIIYSNNLKKTIRQVSLYDSRSDKFLTNF